MSHPTASRHVMVDLPEGGECTVVVHGTPCNVEINEHGITLQYWNDGADHPHTVRIFKWADLEGGHG